MKIYPSSYPPVPLVRDSPFTYLFRTRFNEYSPSSPAYIDAASGFTITRAQTRELSLSFAYGLRHTLAKMGGVPVTRGDVVMLFSPNSIAWPVVLFGGWAAGLRMTLANSSYTPREVAYQWQDSKAKVVVVHPNLLATVLDMFKLLDIDLTEAQRRIIVADWGVIPPGLQGYVCMSDLLGKNMLPEEEKFSGELAQDTALLCYSSGTTGKPKGVETTHQNITSVIDITAKVWPQDEITAPRTLGVLPYYHVYGVIILVSLQFFLGIPMVIMTQFDPVAFCRAIEQYKITHACVVPPICLIMSRHPAVEQFDMRSLRQMFSAAAPLSKSLLETLDSRLRKIGADVCIFQGYGLTETSPTAIVLPSKEYLVKAGSVGLLLPNMEARIMVDDVKDANEGEPGELWLRGPTIFKGYLDRPDATKSSITEQGWFKTGDIVTRDPDGYYAVVDRLKELIKYKGFQVAPAELESVLIQHPDIADAGVIGVYSEAEVTELPRAYIVTARQLGLKESQQFIQDVHEWLKDKISRHKHLRGGIAIVDAIPKSAAGKILRRQLRDIAQAELDATVQARAKL
ncbi:hypothetical protein PHLGIDRAFT_74606 [Phlebiopsis gigantea 11061_1 CR5-6]|uniref:AMP-dependent synthetase/ligase domain-containing protein n=1 Tax=Phlebiopsis gigantea (strain 11061_1 CR5-6) TaxID=745531 RepID=A0A0C3RVE0_PHLG1|nr:hypothetical protein PHLGIDRAFT_74606 [Phlebiopsis gigantea 11061_1 CR5-6]